MVDFTFQTGELEYFLLVLVRCSLFVFAAPFFGTKGVPNRVKIAISVALALLLYNYAPHVEVVYHTVLGYAIIVLKEAFTGLIIGLSANLCTQILTFAGHLVDMETGLSMVSTFDPMTNNTVTITGSYYQYVVLLMLFISGLYQYILAALAESFTLIPINGAVFSSEKLLSSLIMFLGDYLSIGFRICLPVFVVMLLLNAILGVLAKVSPQLNMFAVGIQLKILIGLGTMFITVALLPSVSSMILTETKKVLTVVLEAMQ